MRVLITGTSQGIGFAAATYFISAGHQVVGFDKQASNIDSPDYKHYQVDIVKDNLPIFDEPFDIVINNAGTQNDNDMMNNYYGTVNITEKYGIQPNIKSILMVSSASAIIGAEFPEYCASKGAMSAYGKNVAQRVAKYNATCNNLCPGGVYTPLNTHIVSDNQLHKAVLKETMLNRWATADEIAQWIYFLTVTNKFMTAQDVLVDGGEQAKSNFIW